MKLKLNLRQNLILLLVIIPFLLFAFLLPLSKPKPTEAQDDYVEKIVAVVYDDSGSMGTEKYNYAKYAMQVLMSTLDSRDTLKVFQLNCSDPRNTSSEDFVVNLQASDRNAEIERCVKKLKNNGSWTNITQIKTAIDWLAVQGLNKYTTVDGKEFKLIIITDGDMYSGSNGQNVSKVNTSDAIGSMISGYMGLQTSFFGICVDSGNNVDNLVSQNSSVKQYKAATAPEIVARMQEITNATTGRYNVPNSAVTKNGTKVYVDLSQCGFSVKSLSILAQSNGASVKVTSINSATPLIKSLECNLSSPVVNLYGYSVLLTPDSSQDASEFLSNETITLEFESTPSNVLILVEPAVNLSASLQYYDDTSKTWLDITEDQINSDLRVGNKIRTRYKILDAKDNSDITSTFTNVDVSVSYGGNLYGYNDEIPLVNGKSEVVLSVTININGSKYHLYDSWACDIDSDPEHYSITPTVIRNYNGDRNKVRIDYLIRFQYEGVSQTDLLNKNVFEWSITSLTDNNGKQITNYTTSVSGATISLVFDMEPSGYGDYVADFKIVWKNGEVRKTRVDKQVINKSIEDLVITKVDSDNLILSTYELKNNTKAFKFKVTDVNYPINFNSGLIGYKLTVGGVDVTSNATIIDNVISFIPNSSMDVSLQKIASYNVILQVWDIKNTATTEKSTSKLTIKLTDVSVVTKTTIGVNGDPNKVKIDYTVYSNNKLVSESDLKGTDAVFANSNQKVTDPKGKDVSFVTSISGGTISLTFDKTVGNYGDYNSQITVEKIGDNNPITASAKIEYYISDLIIKTGTNATITLNEYELKRNDKYFEFSVTDKDYPINFNSGLIGYTLKIGGVDVTSYATISDNKITFTPSPNMPKSIQAIASYNVVLDVWSVQNKSIKEQSTLKLNIVNAPAFEIVSNVTEGVNGDANKIKIDYTVYYDNKVVSKSDLEGTSAIYKYQLVQLKDPKGNDITYDLSVIGGTISVIFDRVQGNYGDYTSKIDVTKIDDNRLISKDVKLEYYISDLIIKTGTNATITLNEYELKRNDKSFEFSVTDKGYKINFNSGLIGYTLKIGGVDVTSYATIIDNKITFTPSPNMPKSIQAIGNYNVVLDVWSENSSVKEQSTLKLNVVKAPNFTITTNVTENVNGNADKVKIDYTVYYDDKVVSQNDLIGANPIFNYELVELKDPNGNKLIPEINVNGGTISVIFDRVQGNYGIYKARLDVTKIDDNRTITKSDNLEYYISNLIVENGDNTIISLNSYELERNTKAFEFSVTDKGYPINFDSGLIGYTLKIGRTDVTSYATIIGNKLIFTPNAKMPTSIQSIANYDVVLDVWSYRDNTIKTQSKLVLEIVKAPDLLIVPTVTEGVNGDDKKVKIDFVVMFANNVVSESDLTGANALFNWEVIDVIDPNYSTINALTNVQGGTISLTFNKKEGLYGEYKAKIKVTKVDDNRSVTSEVSVKHLITKLIITSGDVTEIVLNNYELKRNTKTFEFNVTDNGYPINFNSGLIGYTLKIDGVDVTSKAVIENNKLSYTPNANMPSTLLGISNKNVVLEVWSKNSSVKEQSTLKLNIIKAPNFSIITNTTVGVDGDENKVKVDYTVYYDDKVVSESALNGTNPIFSWEIVDAKDPKGNDLKPLGSVTGGTISLVFDITPGNYGIYKSKISVTKIDDERPIVSEVKVEHYISDLIITKKDNNDISLNTYQLKRNDKAFEFSVTDKGYPINFNSNLIGYTLKIGGVDVTNNVVIKDNTLKYVPNSTLPTELQKIKDYSVVLEVWSKQNANIKENSVSQLSIIEAPNFNMTSKSTLGVDGDVNKIKVDYTIYYDNKKVSKAELEDGANQLYKIGKVNIKFSEDKNFNGQYSVAVEEGTISIIFDKLVDKFGVYTVNISVIKIDDDRQIENEINIDCFITDLKIEKGNDGDISLTTYELRKNQKAFEFILTNEGRPIGFNSGSIGYTFTIDGLDLTDKVTIENNVLKYVPNLNMPIMLQVIKDKDVVLEVWSIRDSSINAKAVSKFSLVDSVYKVEAITDSDNSVDIYDLKNCQAKVYYKISVDGNALTSQELLDGLNDGLIQIDTQPLGWIFLLPTQVTTEVVNNNGDQVICLSVGTSWISPLDNLFASFIFTGEKVLKVKCGGSVGEGIITLTHVDFLSRLWRWAVIIVTLYIIIHILLWIIGFFVAKRLPKGVLVQMKLKPENPKFLVNITSELINTEKKTIILWHLKRFIPFMEFKDQEPISKFGVILQIEDRDSVMVHLKPRSIIKMNLEDDEPSEIVRKWRRNWQEYLGGYKPSIKITTKQLNSLLEDMDKEVKPSSVVGLSENYYATKNIKGRIDTILFFKYID